MKLRQWFAKWWTRELAPQTTEWERRARATPGQTAASEPNLSEIGQMERDPMIQTALTIKRLGVLAAPSRIVVDENGSEGRRRLAFVEQAFARMAGSAMTVLDQAMDAFLRGWSVQELVFEEADGALWLARVQAKDVGSFGLNTDRFGRVTSLRLEVPGEVEADLPREKFVLYVHRASPRRPLGQSDLEAARPHFRAKQELLRAWQLYLERFAAPTMLGAFEASVSAADRQAVLNALNDMARVNAIVHPREVSVSAVGGEREASNGFIDAIDFHNREMARAIVGQTLTTDEGRRVGSLALGQVHLQVFVLQLAALRKDLADRVLTEQVIRPLVELNFGPGPIPRFEFEAPSVEAFTKGLL